MSKEIAFVDYQLLIKKMIKWSKKLLKNLVSSQKSSTFAPDLRLRLVSLKKGKNLIKNGNAENQPLTKKMTKFCKKVA